MLVVVCDARTRAAAASVTNAMSIVETKQAAATTFMQGQAIPEPVWAFGRYSADADIELHPANARLVENEAGAIQIQQCVEARVAHWYAITV
ncbi:hypothetical protein D3C72_2236880 [compost metagenome]